MPTFQADDQTLLHYRVLGDGPRDVLLVHGWMTSGAVYDAMAGVLDLEGLRLIIPDLRGSGRSGPSKSGYSLERYGRDVLAVAEHAGLQRFALVGHSMGGQVAQWVAASAPERVLGLALLCSVPASGMALPPEAAGLFRTSGRDGEKQRTILNLACKQLAEADLARLLADAASISPECIQGAFDAWTKGGFAERLAAITAPTLVVATDDPFLPPAFLQQQVAAPIARSRMVVLPGPGHYPQVERPRETAAVLGAFLAGLQG